MNGKSQFQHGDLVFAKVKGYPFWPARIDCVRLEKCRKRKQKNIPEDQNSYWPIFFYGTRELLWIAESELRPFEENRQTLGKASTKKKFKEAMIECFTSPMINFQFSSTSDEKRMVQWLEGESEEVNTTGWDALEENEKERDRQKEEKKAQIPDDEIEEDRVVTEYKNSIFKIKDIDVDDSIGAMYEAPYYGRVISKSDDSIKVQYYTRRRNSETEYIIRKKDIDDIPETRQGYIFYHLDKKYVDYVKDGKLEVLKLLGTYDHSQIDELWEKWNVHTMKIRGQDVPEKTEKSSEREKRTGRRSRINKEELPESPAKQARTESVLESLDEKNNEKIESKEKEENSVESMEVDEKPSSDKSDVPPADITPTVDSEKNSDAKPE